MLTFSLVKIFHILTATLWFAYPLGQGRGVKLAMAEPGAGLSSACKELLRRTKLSMAAGVITGISGAVLIQLQGGLANAAPQLLAAIGVVLLMLTMTIWVVIPLAMAMEKCSGGPTEQTAQALQPLIKKYHSATGLLHLGWLVTLALMILR